MIRCYELLAHRGQISVLNGIPHEWRIRSTYDETPSYQISD